MKIFSSLLAMNLSSWEEDLYARLLLEGTTRAPLCLASEHQMQFGMLKQKLSSLPSSWVIELCQTVLIRAEEDIHGR